MLKLENHSSLWQNTPSLLFHPLSQSVETEVCVIGAGIVGLSVAYQLSLEGVPVVVLEAADFGEGQSGRTTAHLTAVTDDRFFELKRKHGIEVVKKVVKSHLDAIHAIEQVVHFEKLDCDFSRVDGYLMLSPGQSQTILKKEHEIAQEIGLTCEWAEQVPFPHFQGMPALRFPRQAQFHPLKYMNGLASAIVQRGGKIFTRTQVRDIHSQEDELHEIITHHGFKIHAQELVVATNVPINDRFAIHTKQYPYRTYVVGFNVPNNTYSASLLWDTADPYHYVRIHDDVLIVGGADHRTGQDDYPERNFNKLEKWARDHFPEVTSLVHQWSGQVIEPVDGLPYIGRNPGEESVYVATGHSGQGMTYGTVAGMIISDLIQGRENELEEIYRPDRINLRSTPEYLKENANTAAQYGDWLKNFSEELDAISLDSGAIVSHGIHKVAAYRDGSGEYHLLSATCPHLYGVVRWNESEKTWDCPCHGSRFDCLGHVIEGPATSDLKPEEEIVLEKLSATEKEKWISASLSGPEPA